MTPRTETPLTAEEEARIRRHAAEEPWQLPDRINTIQNLVQRLLATLDAARSTPDPTGAGLREAVKRFIDTTYPNNADPDTSRLTWTVPERAFGDLRRALAQSSDGSLDAADVERDADGKPIRFWWCPAWGTLNATRYHGNDGPDDPNCGKVSYFRAARLTEHSDAGKPRG